MQTFRQFINESLSAEEIEAILYLLQLGLISPRKDWGELSLALQSGKISAEQLAGVNADAEIEYEPGAEDIVDVGFFEEVIRTWSGPGGVRALWAEGTVTSRGTSLDLFLSSGDRLHFDEDLIGYEGSHAWLERGGQRLTMDDDTLAVLCNDLTDQFDGDTGRDYWHDLFSELVSRLAE